MDADPLAEALRQASDTRMVRCAVGALASVDAVVRACAGERPVIVVADARTYAVAGAAVEQRLRAARYSVLPAFVFAAEPALQAAHERVLELQAALAPTSAAPIAVGSGTVNDLTKLAAHRCVRPYVAVATAASVDGYAAFGAAITEAGFKHTVACPAPVAVVGDVDVLIGAPSAMTASGFADLLGKATAGADWLVADALGIEPIDPSIWSLVQPSVRAVIEAAPRLQDGDVQSMEALFLGLTMSGLAMQAARSSRPASGSEHQFSHLWEMRGLEHGGAAVSHGFKVGIGSLAIAALYERLLALDLTALDVARRCAGWPAWTDVEEEVRRSHASPVLTEKALDESGAKYVPAAELADRLTRLQACWPTLRERLRAQLLPAEELRRLLRLAGCPTDPADIGITRTELRASYAAARQIRRRYTVLDLAVETGTFASLVDGLFAPGGFWHDVPDVAAP